MAKSYRFYNDAKTVEAEYVTDGMLNHETFFLTEERREGLVDRVAGLDLNIQPYTEAALVSLAGTKGLTLEKWNDGKKVGFLVSDNNFTAFAIKAPAVTTITAVINPTLHTIALTVANATVVTALVAIFQLSEGASAKISSTPQVSGTTANNFTSAVTYSITSANGVSQNWVVTITVAA